MGYVSKDDIIRTCRLPGYDLWYSYPFWCVANLNNLAAIQQTMFTEVKFYINPGHPEKLNTILIDARPINT